MLFLDDSTAQSFKFRLSIQGTNVFGSKHYILTTVFW
jgi:hypothetical protein